MRTSVSQVNCRERDVTDTMVPDGRTSNADVMVTNASVMNLETARGVV